MFKRRQMMKKAGKIMAMFLATTMMLGTVTVGAEELGAVELITDLSETAVLEASGEETNNISGEEAAFDEQNIGATQSDDSFNGANKISADAKKVFRKIGGRKNKSYMYKKLSKAEKKIYDNIDKEVNRILYDGEKLVKGKGSSYYYTKDFYVGKPEYDRFEKVYDIYKLDNPQAFFLSTGLSGPAKNKRSKYRHYASVWDDTKSAARIKSRGNSIAKNIKALAKVVNKEKSDYQKALKITELLCKRLESGGQYPGLLDTLYKKRNKGYKESYAATYTAIARYCGLQAVTVLGDKDNQNCGHWVRVKIGSKWYNVDPFKSDNVLENEDYERGYNLKYFLKSDSTMKKDGDHAIHSKYKKFYPKTDTKDYKPTGK